MVSHLSSSDQNACFGTHVFISVKIAITRIRCFKFRQQLRVIFMPVTKVRTEAMSVLLWRCIKNNRNGMIVMAKGKGNKVKLSLFLTN
jgi:hypothetical protein